MRKAAIFVALVALLVLFAACQPVEKAEEPTTPIVPTTTGKVNITILPPPADNTQTQSSGMTY